VTTIHDAAFPDCSQLATLVIPSGVVTISEEAFAGCSALTELEIPSTVRTIGFGFIDKCSTLRRLKIPSDYGTQSTGEKRWGEEFWNVGRVEHLTLVGARLTCVVVADVKLYNSATAKVIGPDLAGQRIGSFTIAAV
jgi:hypothetical protein